MPQRALLLPQYNSKYHNLSKQHPARQTISNLMNTHITTLTPPHALPSTPAQETALLLKPKQLARRLGISRRTLSNWTQNKTVPMIKIGRFCRFEFDKVWAALQKHEQAAAGSQASTASADQGLQAS
jgi:excisionase family DNA binding protein